MSRKLTTLPSRIAKSYCKKLLSFTGFYELLCRELQLVVSAEPPLHRFRIFSAMQDISTQLGRINKDIDQAKKDAYKPEFDIYNQRLNNESAKPLHTVRLPRSRPGKYSRHSKEHIRTGHVCGVERRARTRDHTRIWIYYLHHFSATECRWSPIFSHAATSSE